jgi:hypothetical protein
MDDGDLTNAQWRKSSYSTGGGSNCVLVAAAGRMVGVRDSKQGKHGTVLLLSRDSWQHLTSVLKGQVV